MTNPIAERLSRIKPSPTLAVTAKAAELKAAGKDVIGLGAGEPDFDTAPHIKEAAIKAIQDGYTKYTAVDGLPQLKTAIINKLARENDLEFAPSQILASTGAKQSLYNLCQALLNPEDEVIIPAPYWVSYPDMVLLAEAEPVIVSAGPDQGFKISPDQLENAITPKTKLFMLNSPSNPTGAAYTRAELEALGAVLERHPQVWVVTDDIYEHIYWADEPFVSMATCCSALKDRMIVVNGVSKGYAMTGWRMGYAAGPESVILAMKKLQGQCTSNPCSVTQMATVAALDGPQDSVRSNNIAFKERHDYVVSALNDIPGFDCLPGAGTFYAFPNVTEAIAKTPGVDNDVDFCAHLMEAAGVAVVPGTAFGAPGCLRLSYATSMDVLEDAIGRIKRVVEGT